MILRAIGLVVSVVCVVAAAAAVAAWGRGYGRGDRIQYQTHPATGLRESHRLVIVRSGRGGVMVFVSSHDLSRTPAELMIIGRSAAGKPATLEHATERPSYPVLTSNATSYPGAVTLLGFQFARERRRTPGEDSVVVSVTVPWAAVVAALLAWPVGHAMR